MIFLDHYEPTDNTGIIKSQAQNLLKPKVKKLFEIYRQKHFQQVMKDFFGRLIVRENGMDVIVKIPPNLLTTRTYLVFPAHRRKLEVWKHYTEN